MIDTIRILLASGLIAAAAPGYADDIAVVVHPSSTFDAMTREQVSHIFLGRIKTLPSGQPAEAFDSIARREAFYRSLVGKDLAEINAYWARLRFSGRTQPPQVLEDDRVVIERVAREPGAIGYVDARRVDARVKTVITLHD